MEDDSTGIVYGSKGEPVAIVRNVREEGPTNQALIASAPDLLAERDRLLLQVREMTEDRDAWIKKEVGTSNRLVEVLLQVDQMRRALMAMNTCGHVARIGEDLVPNADRDRSKPEGWKPCRCMDLALQAVNGPEEAITEKRVGSSPTDRPCCVEAYSRGFEMGKAKT